MHVLFCFVFQAITQRDFPIGLSFPKTFLELLFEKVIHLFNNDFLNSYYVPGLVYSRELFR